jgi:hypothetical protein
MRFNPENYKQQANAVLYAKYRRGDSIRSVCEIDQLGVCYALYVNRPVYRFHKRQYEDEFVLLRYVLTSPKAWNRWVVKANQL